MAIHHQLLLVLCSLGSSLLSTAAERPWQLIGQWDNDLLTGTDEGYTNGARIAFARQLASGSEEHYILEKTLRRLTGAERGNTINHFRFPDEGESTFQYGIGLTQLMFTPENTTTATPPQGERPYAGWMGLEFSLQASAGDSASSATLSIGTTGQHSYAQEVQEWVHNNISDSPIFQGWDSQAPAELTINVHLDHKQRLRFFDHTQNWPLQIDGFYEWGAALGNFRTDAYLGALLRIGHNLPNSYITPRVQLGSFTATIFDNGRAANQDFSIYAYTGARGYAVLHDITLDGPVFRDWDESVNSEPWVGEFSFGIAARYKWIEVSLSHTLRGDEFEHQENRSRYGSILLRLTSSF
ncbi:lipid A deacylase LpxR family protein [Coraliomargarita sp. SDUM461004]|uniref:Lipid A deacylase LpxR family protein n=1 Tax=Thalassobacterium sedimentorum TaxID=3041258 RepID=A0ABU1AN10_9BACT|nr:lipid A deacylase LpxR family protein [Coraliomargarita sp. SDUM461004]MDQ8194993.1 lipid A deacylase LpxR family protein [Coraliomargarita sp. SDUM461004]